MAEDRADDIGSQFPSDADDTVPLSPVRNRAQVNYSLLPKKLAVPVQHVQTESQENQIIQGRLITVNADYYFLAIVINGEDSIMFAAAKPWHLRQSAFDGKSILGKTYTYLSASVRKVVDDVSGDWYIEEISPRYMPGHELMYTMPVDSTEVPLADSRIEMNLNGHQWIPSPVKKAIVLESLAETLKCKAVDNAGNPVGPYIYIMKPFELRESTWNSLTINNVAYKRMAADERQSQISGSAAELEVIIPYYVAEHSIIHYTSYVPVGASLDVVGTDLNQAGRAWARKFEE